MPTTTTRTQQGRRVHYRCVSTAVEATTEIQLTGVPRWGRIIRLTNDLVSGSGATLDAIVGTVTAPSGTENVVCENGAAASENDLPPSGVEPYNYYASAGILYYRPVPNANNDNVVHSEIVIEAIRW